MFGSLERRGKLERLVDEESRFLRTFRVDVELLRYELWRSELDRLTNFNHRPSKSVSDIDLTTADAARRRKWHMADRLWHYRNRTLRRDDSRLRRCSGMFPEHGRAISAGQREIVRVVPFS